MKCLIVDDEKPARELIRKYCNDVPFIKVIAECKNAYEVMEKLSAEEVDLIFLDIKMPKLTGMQLLRSLNDPPKVIITTAFREYALEGFELDVADYLKKPISYDRFLKAVMKVKMLLEKSKQPELANGIPHLESTSNFIFINADKIIRKIMLADLKYVSAMGDYAHFITTNEKYMAYYSLKKVEALLPANLFVRVHRSYIVSLKHIDQVEGTTIFMGDTIIPIGKSFKENFMKLLL